MSSCCPVPTFAAVTRVSVLRPRVAQTVAVDMASVPLLTGLDALITPSAVNEPRSHETGECSALGAMRRAVSGGSEGGVLTLSIAPSHALPQDCQEFQVAQWDGNAWVCGPAFAPLP